MFDRFAALLVAAASLLLPLAALAADDFPVPDDDFPFEEDDRPADGSALDYDRAGFYAAAGGVLAFDNFAGLDPTDGPVGGVDLRLGYRLTPIVSFEAEFQWVGKWDIPGDGNLSPPTDSGELNIYTLSANAKAHLPMGRISPYALFGVGFYRAEIQRARDAFPAPNDFINAMVKGAVGVDFYLTRHVVLTPEFEYTANFDGDDSVDYFGVTAMATYRF